MIDGMLLPRLLEVFSEVPVIAEALRARGWTVAVAESCTGGLLGAALTAVPGSSLYFRGGVVAYADEVKVGELGVDPMTLEQVGAVSEEVAREMASGVRDRLGSDVGLSITGVAGPGGEEGGKPAGLIYVAAASAGALQLHRLRGDHGREENRVRAVHTALRLCLEASR